METKKQLNRRSFLKVTLLTGGAVVFGLNLPLRSRAEERFNIPAGSSEPVADFQPNAFIKIAPDGKVTVTVGQSEMGQGVLTSLPMIVADELEVEWDVVEYEQGPAGQAYANPAFKTQMTGGSSSVKVFFMPLRKSAAMVREMLVMAAAQQWGVSPDTCKAINGTVVHTSTKRTVKYGDLLADAAKITPPIEPKLKDPKDFKFIGKPVKRLDTASKLNGTAIFGIDVVVPGMLYATIMRSPVFGGTIKSVENKAALAIKGVRNIVPLEFGVGVVADNYWAAKKGRDALKIVWNEGKMANVSSDGIYADYANAAVTGKGIEAKRIGDVAAGQEKSVKTIDAVYYVPYLAHATMEPMNATADVRKDSCEVWSGTQVQMIVQGMVAKALGLTTDKVKVNTPLLGGGFGRRLGEYVMDAVLLSKAVGKPVKVVWTREDDIQNDYYRPATYNKMSAGLDASGKPVFWNHRLVSSSIMATLGPQIFGEAPPATVLDDFATEGAHNLPYDMQNLYVDWVRMETGIPVGFWRSVGSSHTAFSTECFLDELAEAAKKDPLEFRLSLLEIHPRHAGVLKLAAEKAGWGNPASKEVFRGLAVHKSFDSYVAQVAEVSVGADGKPKVHRVICAIDCGQIVNPDTIKAQMESSIIFGLTAALYGEITVKNGRVEQNNFYDYKMLRMNETPKIDVYIVPSAEKHGGVGEPGTPPIAPAVVNAIFAATGKRIRSLPIRPEELKENAK